MKNYYQILGVREDASDEEIREHWIELTKNHHPDLKPAEETDDRIKEINSAYQVLKNESTRFDYDFKKIHKKSLLKRTQKHEKRRFFRERIVLHSGILVIFLIVGFMVFKWFQVSRQQESEIRYMISKTVEKEPPAPTPHREIKPKIKVEKETFSPPPSIIKKEYKPEEETAQKVEMKPKTPVPVERKGTIEVSTMPFIPMAKKELKTKEEPQSKDVIKPEISPTFIPPISREEEKPKGKPVEQVASKIEAPVQPEKSLLKKDDKEIRQEETKIISKEIREADQPKPKVTEPLPPPKPQVTEPSPPPPSSITKEEVGKFFANYISRYTEKDVNGFISLFSSTKAIQNQKDDFSGIGKIYAKFFNQSGELRYDLGEMKAEIYQNAVEVRARYEVNQLEKKSGEKKVWRGWVRWTLAKEQGALKIVSLDYQHDKSP